LSILESFCSLNFYPLGEDKIKLMLGLNSWLGLGHLKFRTHLKNVSIVPFLSARGQGQSARPKVMAELSPFQIRNLLKKCFFSSIFVR
jgi:hypothetical protein